MDSVIIEYMGRGLLLLLGALSLQSCNLDIRHIDDAEKTTAVSATYSLSNGWADLSLSSTLNTAGSVYWIAYNTDQGTLSALQVKTSVGGTCVSPCAASATVTVSSALTPVTNAFASLPDNVFYTVYAVSENDTGLDTDAHVKKYVRVIPRKISMQSFVSTKGPSFPIVRHWLYYPAGYYNSSTQYPMMMYLHGGGETPNDATNSVANFTTNNERMDKIPFYVTIKNGQDLPFIAIAPQCNQAFFNCIGGDESSFYEAVTANVATYTRFDIKRFYVYGMSWGGAGTWNYAYDYPARVAAAVPVSGGLLYRSTANICTNLVPNHVAVWTFLNSNDGIYNAAAIGGAGVDNPTAVTIYQGCTGHKDARSTVYPGNIYPATINNHFTLEYTLSIPLYSYHVGWFYNNLGANTFDMSLPSIPGVNHYVPLAPEAIADFATATTQLGSPVNSIYDWMALQSKP